MYTSLRLITLTILLSSVTHAHDICKTKYTLMHYAESQCFEVESRLSESEPTKFGLHTVLITESLKEAEQRPTVIFVPGGPGESAEPLKTLMQSREMLNGIWHSLKANVVLYDPRGTGMSSLPKSTQSYGGDVLSSSMMVEDLKKVIDTVSPSRPVIIVAHSAGGHIALKFAEKFGNRLSSLLLLSASQSPRQMAKLNLALFADKSIHFERLISALRGHADLHAVRKKHDRVEEVLKQQLKARILGQYIEPEMKPITPLVFREALIKRLSLDSSGVSALNLIESFYDDLQSLEKSGKTLTPKELKHLLLSEKDLSHFRLTTKQWIQIQIMCGEGLTAEELDTSIYFEGMTMHRFCGDVHAADGATFDEPMLSQINNHVVFLSGQRDTKVPPYIAKQIVEGLPNAELTVVREAGHMFVDEAPMEFYNTIEKLIKSQY